MCQKMEVGMVILTLQKSAKVKMRMEFVRRERVEGDPSSSSCTSFDQTAL